MGSRGPTAIDKEILNGTANRWAGLFFRLRDGEDGALFHVEWGEWKPAGPCSPADKIRFPIPRSIKTASVLRPGDAWKKLVVQLNPNHVKAIEPVMPQPEIWERLKTARTE